MYNLLKRVLTRLLVINSLLLIGLVFTTPAYALEFECSAGTNKRFIRLELPGIEHLCEVTVTYANDERKVPWYANNDSQFCSDKAAELKDKYENKWNFDCEQWPDHDGVDQLNKRQRTILDTELKLLIEKGRNQPNPFMVEGLKAVANPTYDIDNSLLVVQFFLHNPEKGTTSDVTHIIRDNGGSWNTQVRLNTLSNYIDANEGYIVNSALISSVTDTGAMEVITVLDSANSAINGNSPAASGCYGSQTLAAQNDGKLVARTPHRFVCENASSGDAG